MLGSVGGLAQPGAELASFHASGEWFRTAEKSQILIQPRRLELRLAADISTAVLIFLSVALDATGRATDVSALWISGAYAGRLAIVAGIIALVLAAFTSGVRGVWLRTFALVLFCLAAWVRGSPGVTPDRVVLLAGAAALALMIAGIRRRPATSSA